MLHLHDSRVKGSNSFPVYFKAKRCLSKGILLNKTHEYIRFSSHTTDCRNVSESPAKCRQHLSLRVIDSRHALHSLYVFITFLYKLHAK